MILAACLFCFAQDLDAALAADVKAAARSAAKSVVRLDLVGGREAGGTSVTGTIVRADGLIVTSAYGLASKPSGVAVRLPTGEVKSGRILGVDRVLALALVRVEAQGLTPATPAPKSDVRVGQYAVAVGKTLADEPSVSVGVVSALGRVWGKAVQTDAKVSPTNYGGPLVDLAGRSIGVLAPLSPQSEDEAAGVEFYDSGIGFAVPLDDLLAVVPKLEKGDLARGRLGFAWEKEDLLAEPLLVDTLAWRSPAELAGIKKGDRLVSVAGKPVRRLAEFRHAFGRLYAGDRVALEYARGSETRRVELTAVATLPVYRRPFLGLAFADEPQDKLTIARVWPNSPAAAAKIAVGDVLEDLDGPVRDRAGAERAIDKKAAGENFAMAITGKAGRRTATLTAESFPETISVVARPAGAAPVLTEIKALPPHWQFAPAGANPKPRWLILWQGKPPSDGWKTLCGKANAALVGFPDKSVPSDAEAMAFGLLANLVQKRLGVPPERTAVVGAGSFVSQFAATAGNAVRGGVFLDGPIAISPRQPRDRQRFLAFSRPLGTPILDAVAEARERGAPIVVTEWIDDARAADAVAEWLELMQTL